MCDYEPGILENSAKMVLLFHLIEESVRKGDKLLVFRYKIRQHKCFNWMRKIFVNCYQFFSHLCDITNRNKL